MSSRAVLGLVSDLSAFHVKLFDALPVPTFVVGDDMCIIDFNFAAARLLKRVPGETVGQRGGEVLRCVHAVETPGGCGDAPACSDCTLRNSTKEAFCTGKTVRRIGRMDLTRDTKTTSVDMLVTVAPIESETESVALLMLEDMNELAALFLAKT